MNTLIVVASDQFHRDRLQAVADQLAQDYVVTTHKFSGVFFKPARLVARFHDLHHVDMTNLKAYLGDQVSYQVI